MTSVTLIAGNTYSFKAISRSSYGESTESDVLSVLVAKVPDAPLSLVEVPGKTTGSQVGISWEAGIYDGASPVLDFQVNYRVSTDTDWIVYKDGQQLTFLEVIGLTAGLTYSFSIQARNVIGLSDYSQEIAVLAA